MSREPKPYTITVVESAPPRRGANWCPKCGGAVWLDLPEGAVHSPRLRADGLYDCKGKVK